jgi:hypothetical protein
LLAISQLIEVRRLVNPRHLVGGVSSLQVINMRRAQKNGNLKVRHNNYLQKERRRVIIAQRIKIRTMWAKADWSGMSQSQALRVFKGYYPTSAIKKAAKIKCGPRLSSLWE